MSLPISSRKQSRPTQDDHRVDHRGEGAPASAAGHLGELACQRLRPDARVPRAVCGSPPRAVRTPRRRTDQPKLRVPCELCGDAHAGTVVSEQHHAFPSEAKWVTLCERMRVRVMALCYLWLYLFLTRNESLLLLVTSIIVVYFKCTSTYQLIFT